MMIAGLTTPASAHDTLYIYNAIVVSVYDGDTMTVNIDLGFDTWVMNETLRLYCIDTPEVRGDEKVHGIPIRDAVREWMPEGSPIRLETIYDRSGKFGRTLALVTPSGWTETVNAKLYNNGDASLEAYSARDKETCENILTP